MKRRSPTMLLQRRVARRALQVILGLELVVSFALATDKRGKEEGPVAQLRRAPHSAQLLRNPFAGQDEAAAAGRKLFEQHCAECHGQDGRGSGHAADLHSSAIQGAPPGVLFWALRNGRVRKGMPSWSQLSDQRLWQVVAYLETLK